MKPHLYLIGIGGVGMVWIADYALAQGWEVSGSDLSESPVTRRLQGAGAHVHIGAAADQIPEGVTEAVVSSAITPNSPSYPEYAALLERAIPVVKRAPWIGKLTRRMRTIAVAGAHGKTTTSAMLGWILTEAGLDPTVFTGSTVAGWEGTKIGKSDILVLEADEFDRSFHQFYPEIAIILNIDLDHTDCYPGGLPEIEHSFRRFLRNVSKERGIVIAYGRDGHIRKVTRGFKHKLHWYDEKRLWPGLKLQQPGLHVVLNATAAAKAAHELGVSSAVIQKALASFPGTGRRFELVGEWGKMTWYDDYAHHPRELAATLQALREKFPNERTVVVFQPHQKRRTLDLLSDFARAFDAHPPTELIIAPIYAVAGREEAIEVSSADLVREILTKKVRMSVQLASSVEELEEQLRVAIEQPGVLVTVGAGSIRALVQKWQEPN
jgi:UDP-N-acetylmuramate--alanine ligase